MRTVYIGMALMFLVGCTTIGPTSSVVSAKTKPNDTKEAPVSAEQLFRADLLSRGYLPAYVDGYELGCKKVTKPSAIIIKDKARYAHDREYARGWNQGIATCSNSYGKISKEYWDARRNEISDEDMWNEIKK